MEQENLQKVFNELEIIEKSIKDINALNTRQNKELKQLKNKQYKTSAMLHQLMAAVCAAVLFFYFEASVDLPEDKKIIIENIIVFVDGAAGINSGMRIKADEKHSEKEE